MKPGLANPIGAQGFLEKAIDTYLAGFETDWRDAYPGINAITLMELRDPPDERRTKLIPVARYSAERKLARGKPDYWDYATLLELAVLDLDQKEAIQSLARVIAHKREKWGGPKRRSAICASFARFEKSEVLPRLGRRRLKIFWRDNRVAGHNQATAVAKIPIGIGRLGVRRSCFSTPSYRLPARSALQVARHPVRETC